MAMQGLQYMGMQPSLALDPSLTDGLEDIPVGGCLQWFASEWETVTSDLWVLSVVGGGERATALSSPPLLCPSGE